MAAKRKAKQGIERAATLTIKSPGMMTARGRRDIASWLRRQANHLIRYGRHYTTGRFTAGFNYTRD